MDVKKYLIVNADDFGQSRGITQGIIKAYESGIVTSASLMVRWPAAVYAAAYGREHPRLSLGLHVDLGEWIYREQSWVPLYEVVTLESIRAVREEVVRQLAAFYELLGKQPSHIDSHQHVHLREPARSVLLDIARQLQVPLRHFSPAIGCCGRFYGQTTEGAPFPDAITSERLIETLAGLPEGFTELTCHPGEGDDLETMYLRERAQELKILCDPQLPARIAAMGITLCSFANLQRSSWQASDGSV